MILLYLGKSYGGRVYFYEKTNYYFDASKVSGTLTEVKKI